MILNRLRAFISSTGDLENERLAVAAKLESLEIDDSRFELWASSSNDPISECLRRVEEAELFILLLGRRYGSELPNGLSYTHQEYHHARKIKLQMINDK